MSFQKICTLVGKMFYPRQQENSALVQKWPPDALENALIYPVSAQSTSFEFPGDLIP